MLQMLHSSSIIHWFQTSLWMIASYFVSLPDNCTVQLQTVSSYTLHQLLLVLLITFHTPCYLLT